MSVVKLDTRFPYHPQIAALSDAAFRATVEAIFARRFQADDGPWLSVHSLYCYKQGSTRPGRPYIPVAIRREVFERDGYQCVECLATERLSLDHVIPYSHGGPDTVENLRVLCLPCNVRRGAPIQ